MRVDPTAIIVALIGLVGVWLGVYFSRKGQRRSEEQADAVADLAEQKRESDRTAKTYDTQQAIIHDLIAERDRIYNLHVEERARADAALAGAQAHIVTLTNALIDLGALVDSSVARSAALVSEEDPNSPEAVQRVKDFVNTLRQIGEGK